MIQSFPCKFHESAHEVMLFTKKIIEAVQNTTVSPIWTQPELTIDRLYKQDFLWVLNQIASRRVNQYSSIFTVKSLMTTKTHFIPWHAIPKLLPKNFKKTVPYQVRRWNSVKQRQIWKGNGVEDAKYIQVIEWHIKDEHRSGVKTSFIVWQQCYVHIQFLQIRLFWHKGF